MGTYDADPVPDTDKIRQVAHGYAIAPLESLKVDQHSAPDSKKCYHLVKRFGSTNVWVLVDPAILPAI